MTSGPQARTVDILKGQLGEVDAQVAAKLIEAGEADALRAEIKRRILVEDRDAGTVARPLPQTAMPWVALGLVAIVTLCATALYALMGHPELTSSAPPRPKCTKCCRRFRRAPRVPIPMAKWPA